MKFKAASVFLHISPKPLLKKNSHNFLTWRYIKECKICVTIRIYVCSCLWETATQKYFQSKVVPRSSHQVQFSIFNFAVLHLWCNSLKNTCGGVWFLVNLHLTLSNFKLLLWKFKYFITALINTEQLLL